MGKSSSVWLYFDNVPASDAGEKDVAVCKACRNILTARGKDGTSHLRRHLNKHCRANRAPAPQQLELEVAVAAASQSSPAQSCSHVIQSGPERDYHRLPRGELMAAELVENIPQGQQQRLEVAAAPAGLAAPPQQLEGTVTLPSPGPLGVLPTTGISDGEERFSRLNMHSSMILPQHVEELYQDARRSGVSSSHLNLQDDHQELTSQVYSPPQVVFSTFAEMDDFTSRLPCYELMATELVVKALGEQEVQEMDDDTSRLLDELMATELVVNHPQGQQQRLEVAAAPAGLAAHHRSSWKGHWAVTPPSVGSRGSCPPRSSPMGRKDSRGST